MSRRLVLTDLDYPAELHRLPRPPASIYVDGALPRSPGVTVVGTRRASPEALRFARALGATLARAGYVVYSGGALGVDEAAHEGVFDGGGVAVLVTGGGLAQRSLRERRLDAQVAPRGARVALVPDETPPLPWMFLSRNAVLAALGDATVLVECPLESGARNTAAWARRVGRPVWIVPQAPWMTVAGAVREELRLGARPLLHVEDLLATLPPTDAASAGPIADAASAEPSASPELPDELRPLFELLAAGPLHPDELCDRLALDASRLGVALGRLVLEGLVVPAPGGRYARKTF